MPPLILNNGVPPIEVAIAILVQGERFLMQLRDDIPGILYPGHWGFFGGHLDPGETPEAALLRELDEEIGYRPAQVMPYVSHWGDGHASPQCDRRVIRHVFVADLDVPVHQLNLAEGWDLGLLDANEVQAGQCYSAVAERQCPIGAPHRDILLAFIQAQGAYYQRASS